MVSKSQSKLIRSLSQKKYRNKHQLFIVEGIKGINEFISEGYTAHTIFYTETKFEISNDNQHHVTEKELQGITNLTTAQNALAVFKIPKYEAHSTAQKVVVLDGVRDPGNLGTIIRLCDWFGVEALVCSKDTVDCYNPKVVQASMGSLARLNIEYLDLIDFLPKAPKPLYGTFMNGNSIYKTTLDETYTLIMGNEANGISAAIETMCTKRISIPQFGPVQNTESLNVATATAICLSEFNRATIEM